MGGTSPKFIYFRSIFPLLLSHKLYFCSTKVQKVGKLVGNYFCSTTVQKVCKPVGFYYCSTTVKKVGKLVGIYFCCTVYYGFYCSSTKVQHELVDYSVRTPSQILGEDALGRFKPLDTFFSVQPISDSSSSSISKESSSASSALLISSNTFLVLQPTTVDNSLGQSHLLDKYGHIGRLRIQT